MDLSETNSDLFLNNTTQKEYTKESRLVRIDNINKNKNFQRKIPKIMTTINVNKPNDINKNKSKPKKEKTGEIKSKLKTQLNMMFINLSKVMKKEGLFLETDHTYEKITLMKDFNVQILGLKDKKHQLSVRSIVGIWTDFRKTVTLAPNDFSNLKSVFSTWSKEQINSFEPNQITQNAFDSIINRNKSDFKIIKYLPQLEEKILSVWRKPTKQPKGFIHRAEQIYELWNQEAQEIHHIEQIESELNFQSYEQTFPLARSLNRKFSIFIGPTNSGKTFNALNELAKGKNGCYLAPLRLMAAEGQEALGERGIKANLITGEEQVLIPHATHTSSTIEMCHLNNVVDVAVIDEIQMISDISRGWAWSQALIGVAAKHVVLVGSEEALPFIIPVLDQLGEEYEIRNFERKTPLHTREPMWKLQDLKENDCVVVFSRKNALEMKNEIEMTGKKCSVIYGNLSPEVRRAEANKFKSGENPILVATDAIGMGLNLPIQRLFFSTMEKFDGVDTRQLTISEIKQIAGRAGRYGFAKSGDVGVLFDNSHSTKDLLHKAIYLGYEKAHDTRIPIAPNLEQIKTICSVIGKEDLYSALIFFKEKLIRNHEYYKTANLESMIEIAGLLKSKKLDLVTGFTYSCVPIDINSDFHLRNFHKWINNHIHGNTNKAPDLPEVLTFQKTDSYSLYEVENYVKLCMSYRWLHYKFPETYDEPDIVSRNAKTSNDYIEKSLHRHITISKNPKYRK